MTMEVTFLAGRSKNDLHGTLVYDLEFLSFYSFHTADRQTLV